MNVEKVVFHLVKTLLLFASFGGLEGQENVGKAGIRVCLVRSALVKMVY